MARVSSALLDRRVGSSRFGLGKDLPRKHELGWDEGRRPVSGVRRPVYRSPDLEPGGSRLHGRP